MKPFDVWKINLYRWLCSDDMYTCFVVRFHDVIFSSPTESSVGLYTQFFGDETTHTLVGNNQNVTMCDGNCEPGDNVMRVQKDVLATSYSVLIACGTLY